MVAVVSAIVEDRTPPASNSVRTMQCPKRCSSKADNKAWLKARDKFLKISKPISDVVVGKATVNFSSTVFASFGTGKKPLFNLVVRWSEGADVGEGEAASGKDPVSLTYCCTWWQSSIARCIQSAADCTSICTRDKSGICKFLCEFYAGSAHEGRIPCFFRFAVGFTYEEGRAVQCPFLLFGSAVTREISL
jgi:hypothetical protein